MKKLWFILFVLSGYGAAGQCVVSCPSGGGNITPSGTVAICPGNNLTLTAPYTPGDTWTRKTDLTGAARENAVAFTINTKGYLGTGKNASSGTLSDFWEYDFATDAWTQKADFGGGTRWGAVGFSIGTKGYVGTGRSGASTFNDFWEYNPATNTWTAKAAFTGTARYLAAGFSDCSKGYIGTGWNGTSRFTDFRQYDPATNTWTTKAVFPGSARHSAVGFNMGAKGYICTGSVDAVTNAKDLYEYDPATNAWAAKANLPGSGRYGAATFTVGTKIFVGLGYNNTTYFNDFYEYDYTTNTWTARANYTGPTGEYVCGFSNQRKGYFCTGLNGATYNKQLWEYDPARTYLWSTGATTESINVSTTGNYNVVVNWSILTPGCPLYTSSTTEVIATTPEVSVSPPGPLNICSGNSVVLTAEGSNNSWTQKANVGTTGRTKAVGFSIGPKGYIGTGINGATNLNDFWEYDPATDVWTQKANFGGVARSSATGFGIGSKGYIGTGINGATYLNDFWEYDPATNVWTQKANFGGVARSSATGFDIGSKGYIGLGTASTGYLNDFWEYNPATNAWTARASFGGVARAFATGFSINGKGYLGTGVNVLFRKDFWEYDPATNTWVQKADFPAGERYGSVGFSLNNKGYLACGDTGTIMRDVWEYAPSVNTWRRKQNFSGAARIYATAFSIGSKAYIGTGSGGVGNDFWEYGPNYTYQWSTGANTQSITVSAAGNYSVTITDINGCTATSSSTLIAVTNINPTIDPAAVTLCQPQTAVLTANATANWKQRAGFGGTARFAAVSFSIGTKGYLGTGNDLISGRRKDFWEYDPATNTWTQRADFGGTARNGAIGFSIGLKGYLGVGNDGIYKKDFWEYDPATNTWVQKADFGGTARADAVGFSIGTKGYIGTGADATGRKRDFWEYNPGTNTWVQKADFGGTARFYATGFSIGVKGYLGTGNDISGIKKDFWEYDPGTNTWVQKADFGGTGRMTPVGFGLGSKGYILTGNDGTLVSGEHRKDFWEYDPASNSWQQKTNFPGNGRTYATGFVIDNKAYLGTGATNGTASLNDFWEYSADFTYLWSTGANTQSITASSSGSYTVTLTDVNGCNATSAPSIVTVNPQPPAGIAASGPTSFCQGGSVTLIAAEATGGNAWIQKANFGGTSRFRAVGLSIAGKGYIGLGGDGTVRNDFWEYDPATDVWTQKANFGGIARSSATGFVIGSKGYIGTGINATTYLNDFWEYNPATNVWTQKADFGGPARFTAVGFSIGSKGYIGTGVSAGTTYKDFWEYDPVTNAWIQKADFGGSARSGAVGFAIGTKGYIGTGQDITPSFTRDFWEYDPATNAWIQKADFGGPARSGAVGFAIGSKGYIGIGNNNDFWEYNTSVNQWVKKANFGGTSRSLAVGFSIGNKGYIGTGLNIGLLRDFWEYAQGLDYLWSTGEVTQSITVSATGTYTVNITDLATGCQAVGTSPTITQYSIPAVSVSGSNTICTNSSVLLNANATAGSGLIAPNGYQWKLNGTNIPGATNATYTATTAGSYQVIVTDANGCQSLISNTHIITLDTSPLNGIYTINPLLPASCTNYISFNSAIADLNSRSISGDVQFNVAAGLTETVPVGGLALGSQKLNDSTATGKTISFLKSGSGANPLLTAYTGGIATPGSTSPDGIFSIRGADNVTINAIDLIDNNVANPATMEYGYGLFKWNNNDGVKNTVISNCSITLNRINNSSAGVVMPVGSNGIVMMNVTANNAQAFLVPTDVKGSNSKNKFYSNNISNCNNGIAIVGYSPSLSPFNYVDSANDIGGASPVTGNYILNFGGGGTNLSTGILLQSQWNANVGFNTLNSNNGAGIDHPGLLAGIYAIGFASGSTAGITISNNNITVKGGGLTQSVYGIYNGFNSSGNSVVSITNNSITGNYTTSLAGQLSGIMNNCTAGTLTITGNTVQNCTLTGSGTGRFDGIFNGAVNPVVNISNNNVINNNIASTGSGFNCIATSGGSTQLTMNGNTISGNTKPIAGTGVTNWTLLQASFIATGGTATVNNNIIANNNIQLSAPAPSGSFTLNCIMQSSSQSYTVNGNSIYNNGVTNNINAFTQIVTVSGYQNTSGSLAETYDGNSFRKLYYVNGTGSTSVLNTVQGINSSTLFNSNKIITNNVFDSLYTSSGISSTVYGIRSSSGDSIVIARNTITRLLPGQGASVGAGASGIRIQTVSTTGTPFCNIYNNMIGLDFTGSSSDGVIANPDGLKGIETNTTSVTHGPVNIYFNSIYINGTGGAGFGSSGLSFTSSGNHTVRNNIVENRAIPNGSGRTVALRRNTLSTVVYLNTTSLNQNSWYAGSPGVNNLLYYDGTNSSQTLAQMNTTLANKEQYSVTGPVTFVAAPLDLHINTANNCQVESLGLPIPEVTMDYDSISRDLNYPDIGADEFDGTGAGTTTWKGINSNWNDLKNWCGVLPSSTSSITIPAGKAFYPVISSNGPVVNNITIANGGTVTIANGGMMEIFGAINNSGVFNAVDGTIKLSGASAQTIPALCFQNNDLRHLIINNNVNLAGALKLYGTLSFSGNNRVFSSAGNLTLKSDVNGTASVADMTNGGINSGNNITGDVTVERFINTGTGVGQHLKGWQFLATPTSGQTIRQAWQENGTAPAGFGTIITGTGTGFDITTALPSLKFYNAAATNWTAITNTNNNLQQKLGYMIFVRGDRSVNTAGASPNNTNLRSKGVLFTSLNPPAPVAVAANTFQSFGNPYASRIEFSKVRAASSGINDVFYVWDPTLSGTYGYGGYQTITGIAGYVPTVGTPPTGNLATQYYPAGVPAPYIESGQAVFVKGNGTGGNVNFNETVKTSGSRLVNKAALNNNGINTPNNRALLFCSLFSNTGVIADGNIIVFENGLSNELNDHDAEKIMNAGENFSLVRNGKLLAVEARDRISPGDTIYFNLQNLRKQTYQFRFAPLNINTVHAAYLVDRSLNLFTTISLHDSSFIDFTIDTTGVSSAPDRFIMVFKKPRKKQVIPVATETVRKDLLVKPRSFNGQDILLQVFPNPVEDKKMHIYFGSTLEGNHILQLLNAAGQIVFSRPVFLKRGGSNQIIAVDKALAEGLYQLKLSKGGIAVSVCQVFLR
ncbi:MAG: kelch repeat-containing protein [Ferruginibacter sp.]